MWLSRTRQQVNGSATLKIQPLRIKGHNCFGSSGESSMQPLNASAVLPHRGAMSPHPLGHLPFWCQPSFLWEAGLHLWPNSTNSFHRLSWKESKAIPADALQRKREADTLTFWELWHTNLPQPPHFKTKSGTTVAGALIRYQTCADCVRNDVRWTAVPGPLPHLGQTLKHLFLGYFMTCLKNDFVHRGRPLMYEVLPQDFSTSGVCTTSFYVHSYTNSVSIIELLLLSMPYIRGETTWQKVR